LVTDPALNPALDQWNANTRPLVYRPYTAPHFELPQLLKFDLDADPDPQYCIGSYPELKRIQIGSCHQDHVTCSQPSRSCRRRFFVNFGFRLQVSCHSEEIPNDPGKMFIGGLSWQTTPEVKYSDFLFYHYCIVEVMLKLKIV
jgi:hypothetical protein